MSSIGYITSASQIMAVLVSLGISARIVYLILVCMSEGEEIQGILKKVKRKIAAAVLAICLTAFLGMIKSYYL